MIPRLCKTIIEELGLRVLVETGTDMAESVAEVARWFAELDPSFGKITGSVATGARSYRRGSQPIQYPVFEDARQSEYQIYSVDVCDAAYRDVKALLERNRNIHLVKKDSVEFVKEFVANSASVPVLFFLDAHWGKYWPLRDELAEIVKLDRYAVVIDDFFVPGRSRPSRPHGEFGFDFYGGVVLDWGYIRDLFAAQEVRVFYPTEPNRDGRGTVFLFKGYNAESLRFLDSLGLVAVDKDDPVHTKPVRLSPLAYCDAHYLAKKLLPVSLLRKLVRGYQRLRPGT
jgi:hypothetical protein